MSGRQLDPVSNLLLSFHRRSKADLEAMREALGRGDYETIDRMGHRMVGAAGAFGLDPIVRVARELAQGARAADERAVAGLIERLAALIAGAGQAEPGSGQRAAGPMMRVLLVEDDPIQLALAASWLEDHGHAVSAFPNGTVAMKAMQRDSFDVVILDSMLPDVSGEALLRWIRERNRRLPVMFATARDEEEEIASILRLGADDYVVKPLRRLEFLARVDALARRAGITGEDETPVIEIGPYRIDTALRAITIAGRAVKMTPRMIEVATLLFRRCGELVSRAKLYEQIWGLKDAPDTRTVDTHVSRIRQALELDGRHGLRLSSVYHHGYRLEKTANA